MKNVKNNEKWKKIAIIIILILEVNLIDLRNKRNEAIHISHKLKEKNIHLIYILRKEREKKSCIYKYLYDPLD